ncbi:MAG: glyoxalase [Frankiales bacterium]|nr:glyoxalase [Frankiales bacterium]
MALSGLELHHVAVRMHPDAVPETLAFYTDVLGLTPDPGTRQIPGVPGVWLDTAGDAQVHVFGVEGVSQYARQPDRDPFTRHIALGVPDVQEAKAELERLGVEHWRAGRAEQQQLFLYDPHGNMLELHQTGTCRCKRSSRPEPAPAQSPEA